MSQPAKGRAGRGGRGPGAQTKETTETKGRGRARGQGSAKANGQRERRNTSGEAPAGQRGGGTDGGLSDTAVSSTEPPKISRPFNVPSKKTSSAAFQAQEAHMEQYYLTLKQNREKERAHAIANNLVDDPNKQRRLEDAITFIGTCQDMCPEFERVERIVRRAVDGCEKITGPNGIDVYSQERMVKRFRRSAAGDDAQLPSDVRPPSVLRKTLGYLIDEIVGGPQPLAKVHAFVWDRTRSIRNDFTLQNVEGFSNSDLLLAIDCYQLIARFHIHALHQLSEPEIDDQGFSAHNEREQLNKTLLSLMEFYDLCASREIECTNEAEFRAYMILMHIHDQDVEREAMNLGRKRPQLFQHPRFQKALELYAAASNTNESHGPLRPLASVPIAQNNFARFFRLVKSSQVSYTMACMAEVYFNYIRRSALAAIRVAYRSRSTVEDCTMEHLKDILGFDEEDEAKGFCWACGMEVADRNIPGHYRGYYLVLTSGPPQLADPDLCLKQPYSLVVVESKRHGRTLPQVIHGLTVRQARATAKNEKTVDSAPLPMPGSDLFASPPPRSAFPNTGQGTASIFKPSNPFAVSSAGSQGSFGKPSFAPIPTGSEPSSSTPGIMAVSGGYEEQLLQSSLKSNPETPSIFVAPKSSQKKSVRFDEESLFVSGGSDEETGSSGQPQQKLSSEPPVFSPATPQPNQTLFSSQPSQTPFSSQSSQTLFSSQPSQALFSSQPSQTLFSSQPSQTLFSSQPSQTLFSTQPSQTLFSSTPFQSTPTQQPSSSTAPSASWVFSQPTTNSSFSTKDSQPALIPLIPAIQVSDPPSPFALPSPVTTQPIGASDLPTTNPDTASHSFQFLTPAAPSPSVSTQTTGASDSLATNLATVSSPFQFPTPVAPSHPPVFEVPKALTSDSSTPSLFATQPPSTAVFPASETESSIPAQASSAPALPSTAIPSPKPALFSASLFSTLSSNSNSTPGTQAALFSPAKSHDASKLSSLATPTCTLASSENAAIPKSPLAPPESGGAQPESRTATDSQLSAGLPEKASQESSVSLTESPKAQGSSEETSQQPKESNRFSEEVISWYLSGEGGLLEDLVDYILPNIVKSAQEEYDQEQADNFRRRKLMKKYFYRWHRRAERRAMMTFGMRSRERLRQFANEERKKKRKSDSEVGSLLEISRRKRRAVSPAAPQPPSDRHKRSLTVSDAHSIGPAPSSASTPQRTSAMKDSRHVLADSSHASQRGVSFLSGDSVIRSSMALNSVGPAVAKYGATDTTKSDYWRLKAAGLVTLPNGIIQPVKMPNLSKKRSLNSDDDRGKDGEGSATKYLRRSIQVKAPSSSSSKPALLTNGAPSTNPRHNSNSLISTQPEPLASTARNEDERKEESLSTRIKRIQEAMDEGISFYRSEIEKDRLLRHSQSQSPPNGAKVTASSRRERARAAAATGPSTPSSHHHLERVSSNRGNVENSSSKKRRTESLLAKARSAAAAAIGGSRRREGERDNKRQTGMFLDHRRRIVEQ